ncbi:MAG: hypothetical protein R3F60_26640 [bacterium]
MTVGDLLRLDFGAARASIDILGFTLSSNVAVPDVDLPLRPVGFESRDGHAVSMGLIGQHNQASQGLITVTGNVWVR